MPEAGTVDGLSIRNPIRRQLWPQHLATCGDSAGFLCKSARSVETKNSPSKIMHHPEHHGNASVSKCKCTHIKKGLNCAFFGRETTQLSGHGLSLRTQGLHNCSSQESIGHSWVDVTCFSSLHLTAASQRPQSGLKGYLASQPDWIPTQLSQLECEKWVFFRITRIKAAHGINNTLKHTSKEPVNQGSQLKVWVGIKTAHHSYR